MYLFLTGKAKILVFIAKNTSDLYTDVNRERYYLPLSKHVRLLGPENNMLQVMMGSNTLREGERAEMNLIVIKITP